MTRLLPVLLLLLILEPSVVVAEETDELILEEAATEEDKGVIIELEEEKPEGPASMKKTTGSKRIELIVGGQGDRGVAKRSALIIEK